MSNHIISIVGAGPGDPELLTVKAYKRLKNAEVVLYDALQGEAMLEIAQNAELVYVGKNCSDGQNPVVRQNLIHQQLLTFADQGKKIVRLKAGDPMIFGRGAEEIRFCKENHLNYEVIPGITAAIAASNLLEIPLTERNKSSMVLLYSGSLTNGRSCNINSVYEVLNCGGTVSLYMGQKNMETLSAKMIEKGISPECSVQVISKVSQSEQSIINSDLENIVSVLNKGKIPTPAVFIIGQFANRISAEKHSMIEEINSKAL